ncbi:MAG: RpiB/LacA/LacB family sugar-phosphate isomerase [Bacilli bacterium]|nr:RpiB/LacA/LacB family sugar-phosphate isomerase [Bacilli bacterium]
MKIAIASDHNGYELKKYIIKHMKGIEFIDFGSDGKESTDDYVDYALKVGEYCVKNNIKGILICGSGIGMSIAANKVKGVRCGRVTSIKDVIATRNDNDANIISFAGYLNKERVLRIIETFINTPASNDERHLRRVNKISKYEK